MSSFEEKIHPPLNGKMLLNDSHLYDVDNISTLSYRAQGPITKQIGWSWETRAEN